MTSIYDFAPVYDHLDVLLAQSPSSLASADPSRCMPQVFETLRAIAKVQAKLDNLRANARAWYGSAKDYSMSPFSVLPVEMVMRIFDFAVSEDDVESPLVNCTASFRISHVCRKWRDICLAQPSLWTCASVSNDDEQLFELFVARSRTRAMRLEVIGHPDPFVDVWGCDGIPPLVVMNPLTSVHLRGIWADYVEFPNKEDAPVTVPFIKAIECELQESCGRLLITAQTLCLTASSFAFDTTGLYRSQSTQLHTLTVEHSGCETVSDFFQYVSTPGLRRLTLKGMYKAFDDWETGVDWSTLHAIHLTNLEVLTLDSCCAEMWVGISGASLPRLRELHLFLPESRDVLAEVEEIRTMLSRCGGTVQDLHLIFDPTNAAYGMNALKLHDDDDDVLCPLLGQLHVGLVPGRSQYPLKMDSYAKLAILEVFETRAKLSAGALRFSLTRQLFDCLDRSVAYYHKHTQEFNIVE